MHESTMKQMRARLTAELAPLELHVDDDSHLHAGHVGAKSGGGHFRVCAVSSKFEGLGRVQRHRLVYDIFQGLMQRDIHALALTLLTPAEAQRAKQPHQT